MSQSLSDAPATKLSLPLASEDRLLLTCARVALGPSDCEELVSLLAHPLRWDRIVEKAQWHKLGGLAFSHLRGPEYVHQVPGGALDNLKGQYLRNIARRMYYRAELGRVLVALGERGIPVIVLKGAALVETVYTDPGVRPMADLDLLVPDALAHDAQALVSSLGYRPGGSPEDREDTSRLHRHLPVLIGVEKPVVIEVHRHIVRLDSPLHFDIEGFWRRAQDATIADVRVKVLGTEDLLLHLSLNFFLDRRFHSLAALGQLCDIAETVRCFQDVIDWPGLVERALQDQLAGPMGVPLFLANNLLDAPVPVSVFQRLWPMGFSGPEMTRFVLRRVLSSDPWVARDLVPTNTSYRPLAVLGAMLRRLVPSRRYMASRYGPSARGKSGLLMYLRRFGEGLSVLLHFVGRPTALRDDVSIDRWLHSLYGPDTLTGGPAAAQVQETDPTSV